MVKVKEQSRELFFVQVRDPNEIRKNILGTLKEIVEVLHRFEEFKHIRHERLANIDKLRGLLRETNKMLGNLRPKLPKTNLRATITKEVATHHKKVHHKKKGKGKAVEEKPEKAPKKEMTELEKLEAELSAIESKLKSLS